MRKVWAILISVFVWGAIVLYIVWSSGLARQQRDAVVVRGTAITVVDSARISLVDPDKVAGWIAEAGLDPTGMTAGETDTRLITECVEAHSSVKDAWTYVDMEGTVHIGLSQRRPVARVIVSGGYDFYLTEDNYVLPSKGYEPQYVPVITGSFGLPFDKGFNGPLAEAAGDEEKKSGENYIFICKLINFVKYIGADEFWRSQIVQLNVTEAGGRSLRGGGRFYREPEVEFIPRIGDHVVLLGNLDGYERKLDNLMLFYRRAVPVEGWGKWKHINLKYDNQIVCK